jgi:hypothetical protein
MIVNAEVPTTFTVMPPDSEATSCVLRVKVDTGTITDYETSASGLLWVATLALDAGRYEAWCVGYDGSEKIWASEKFSVVAKPI